MQRARPTYDGMQNIGPQTLYEPGVQIPRAGPGPGAGPAPQFQPPQQRQHAFAIDRRPSFYNAEPNAFSISCTFGVLSIFDITKVLISEFIGTFVLLFVGCTGFVISPLTFGIAIAISSMCFGHVSGAHINPAVTIAAMIMGQIRNFILVPCYFLGQIAGGFAGYAAHYAIFIENTVLQASCITDYNYDTSDEKLQGKVFGVELLFSMFYIMAICALWDRKSIDRGSSIPLKRAFIYTGLVLSLYSISGVSPVSLNSIRSFVPLAFNKIEPEALSDELWARHWLYWVAPNLGAVFASSIYRLLKWFHTKSLKEQ